MQRPRRGIVVQTALGYLHQCVEMRRGPVGEFVADRRRGHSARLTEEQGSAQLALEGADLRGDGGLGEAEQGGGAGEGAGPVHGDEGPQQGQIHGKPSSVPALLALLRPPGRHQL
ncbi:hypothetical protein GCM10017687_41620 [Streptomyces echinatus]